MTRAVVGTLLAAGVAFAAVTLAALEGNEVAVLRTATCTTRVWIVADDGGTPWIEAAHRERPFYRDLLRDPDVELVRGGVAARYRAVPVDTPEAHAALRRRLRARYGFADRWIGMLVDTSGSVAIRLDRR